MMSVILCEICAAGKPGNSEIGKWEPKHEDGSRGWEPEAKDRESSLGTGSGTGSRGLWGRRLRVREARR